MQPYHFTIMLVVGHAVFKKTKKRTKKQQLAIAELAPASSAPVCFHKRLRVHVRGQSPSPLTGMFFLVCPRSVTDESSLGDGIFFSTTTYGGAYVVVIMSVFCFLFVCPRNYLNNVQDIIKVHFCQLRLVVSFNNILYT